MIQDNFSALGNVLHNTMQNVVKGNSSVSVELGIINSDLSLTTDSFPQPIPKGSYMVSIHLTSNHGWEIEGNGAHGGHESGNGAHTHTIKFRKLQSGDRVLVARAGTERIVMAIVTSSNNI